MRGRHAAASFHPLDAISGAARYTSPLVTALLALGAAALLAGAAATVLLGVTVHTVLTGSMAGTFDAGSIVLARRVPTTSVHVGQVLVFRPPGSDTPYTHRVVAVEHGSQGPVIRTQGDANASPDPWRARLPGAHTQEVFLSVPGAGSLLQPLRSGNTRAFAFALLGGVVAVTGVRALLPHNPAPHLSSSP